MSAPVLELFNDNGYVQVNGEDENYFLYKHGTAYAKREDIPGMGATNKIVRIEVRMGMLIFIRGSSPTALYSMFAGQDKIIYFYRSDDSGGSVEYWIYGRPKDIDFNEDDSPFTMYNAKGEPVFISSRPHLKIVRCEPRTSVDAVRDVQYNGRTLAVHFMFRSTIREYEGDSNWGVNAVVRGAGIGIQRADWVFTYQSVGSHGTFIDNQHALIFADVTDHN